MRAITTLLLWMVGFTLMGQTSFLQGFEGSASDNWTYSSSPAAYNVNGDVWDTLSTLGPITAYDGNRFWGMQDLNNGNGGGNFWHYLTFDPVNTSAMGSMELSFWYYTVGYDEAFGDTIAYQVRYDGAPAWTTHGTLLNPNTMGWTKVVVNVPATANSVELRFEAIQNGGSDYAAIDKVELTAASDSVNVTFRVDASLENVTAGVTIAGSFQGWNPAATPMTSVGNGVYEYTAKFKKGDVIDYKFVIDGNNWESVPNACAVNGNRHMTIPNADTTLATVCFSSCTACASLVNLTVQVDMTGQTISANGVHVAGSFQGWNPSGSPMTHIGNNIYSFTVQVQQGSTHQYKFLNGNDWPFVENVPADCGVDDGFGGYNREVTVPADTTLPPVKFSSCDITQTGMNFLEYSMLKTVDANNEPVNKDTTGWIKGVVYSIDFDGNNGYSFFMRDGGEGINIYNSSDVSSYVVTEGDSLHIHGKLGFFRGLIEFIPDSIALIDAGKSYGTPDVVNNLDESTEGNYIRINGVYLADPTQWPTSSGSRNVDIVTANGDTLTMRIDSDTDIDGAMAAPSGNFDVIGCGGQYDPSSPYSSGYQILPRYQMDIITGPDFFDYTMLKTVDANNEPVYKDTVGWIKGIVFSIDFDGNNGYSFFMRDGAEGINVFNFSDVNSYVVTEGDMLHIHGKLGFFRGLIEFIPDSIVVVSQQNAYGDPDLVSNLGEDTEGDYLRINNVYLADPTQWPTSSGSRNVDIVTANGDTLTMRIDSDTDIDGAMPAPAGNFDVIGCGSQYDPSSPYSSGYQILPRYQQDIIQGVTDTPSVFFTLTNITVDESAGFADLTISITDPNSNPTSVDVVVTGGTATAGVDYTFTSPTTVTFPANSSTPIVVQVAIIDDNVQEGDESINFELQNPTNNAHILIANATVTIAANDKPLPVYTVDQINSVDANGEGDSLGVRCELRGVVTTIDYRGGGLQFWIQDPTGGINVFSFSEVSNYMVVEGDSIHVIGTLDQFNGLLEIIPDSIALISTGNDQPEAMEVDTLMEEYESEVLVLNDVEMLDSIPTGGGYNIQALHNGDTIIIRVDDRTDLDTMPFPTGFYRVTGVGSQYDPSAPYFEGYQLMIRRFADFEPMLTPVAAFDYVANKLDVQFTDMSGNYPSAWSWTFGDGSSSNDQNPSHTYAADGIYEVCLTASNSQGSSTSCDSVSVTSVGIATLDPSIGVSIFPVPASGQITIVSDIEILDLQVIDMNGRVLLSKKLNALQTNLSIKNLSNGNYILKLNTRKGVGLQRFVKE